jgi:hypothetical protein
MTDPRVRPAVLLLACGVALAGCGTAPGQDPELPKVATVATSEDGTAEVITLSDAAERRLGITTAPVAAGSAGLVVPYAALVYEVDGGTAVFAETEPLTYQRTPVTVAFRNGDQVVLTAGPPADTEVVTVGAAELVGIETGLDGEE